MPDLRRSMLRLMCVLFVASVTSAVTAQTAKPTGPTVWDGVFTDAQADRAAGTFSQSCERCHTLAAQGTRPLSGDKFWEGYTQKTVGDLLTFVKTNMPNGQGGTLPAPTYNDLVALILKSNGFPSGKTELTPETIAKTRREKPVNTFYFGAQRITTKVFMMAPDGNEAINLDVADYTWEAGYETVPPAI